jgi:hypothetical protein
MTKYRHRAITAIKDPQREVVAVQGAELKSDLVAAQIASRRSFIRTVSRSSFFFVWFLFYLIHILPLVIFLYYYGGLLGKTLDVHRQLRGV